MIKDVRIQNTNLVAKVDAELLKSIELKDLEACNIQHPNEDGFLHGVVHQGVVALLHDEVEHAAVQAPGDTSHRLIALVTVLSLGHPLGTNLESMLSTFSKT